MVYSIPAPFYPKEAELKGLSKTEYGLVCGSFELASFIVCLLIGNYMHKYNPRNAYHLGVCISGTSVILFGFLDLVNGRIPFLVSSFALRILEAVGAGFLYVSSYSMVITRAPNSAATTFVGGFRLPFFVLGGSLFVTGIITYFCFDSKTDDINIPSCETTPAKQGLLRLLELPVVILQAVYMTSCAISLSFLYAVLEPHLRQFDLQPISIGLIFFINGATLAVFSPVWGKICDRISEPLYVTFSGSTLLLIAITLVGPASFLPIKPLVGLVIIGLILNGIGSPAIYVSAFLSALNEAKDHGFLDPNSLVSSLWIRYMALGSCIGPSVAGFLTDRVGFRNATWFVIGVNIFLMGLVSAYKRRHRLSSYRKQNENSALLLNSIS